MRSRSKEAINMAGNSGYREVLKNKEYRKLLTAAIINRLGDSIDSIASAWIVYELTSNAMWSAIVFGINKVPSVIIAPFAGAWVEGKKKKGIMVVTDLIRAMCVAFIATGVLMGFLRAWMIVSVTFIISTAEAFRLPAGSSVTPKILGKENLSHGISLTTAMSTVTELVGMAIAGGIIAIIGSAGAIYIDMATFILSAAIISTIKIPNDEESISNNTIQEYFGTLKMGFKYVFVNKVFLFLVVLASLLNGILVPINSLMAPLANEVIKGGAEIVSVISVSFTVGMLLGTVIYPKIRKIIKKEMFVLGSGIGIGIYYVLTVLVSPMYGNALFRYGFTVMASLLLGGVIALINNFINVEFVSSIDEKYLSRASSIMNAMGGAVTPVMSFIISIVAAYLPTSAIFFGTGIIDLIIFLYLVFSHMVVDILYEDPNSSEHEYAE